jgi:Tfp pilus assembly protein PilF
MEKLKEYLAADPGDSFIRHALAMEYLSRGDYAAARRLLEEVLALDPGAVGSYYQLAKLLEQAGETAEALRCYEKGMAAARAAGETRAFNELRTAYEDLADS